MSLQTLLEAAKFLDNVEQNGGSINGSNYENSSAGGHLLIDPNLPISCQFHTYSSSAPSLPFPISSTNKKSHIEANANQMMIGVNCGSFRRRTMSSGSSSNGRGSFSESKFSYKDGKSGDEKDSLASNRHRELHKTLEKNRRAHLRDCFEQLKKELPQSEYRDRKSSHINIIHCALRYIQNLKRAETENEHEMEKLTKAKLNYQSTISQLKRELDYEQNRYCVDQLLKEVSEKILGKGANNDCPFLTQTSIDCEGEASDVDVIVELEADQDYDDETTTTASECADDVRESLSSNSTFNSVKNSSFLSQCHA